MKSIAQVQTALIAVVVCSIVSVVSPAQAVIVGVNFGGLGASDDGFNNTRDTDTGLDWLDLTITRAENYNDVVAGSFYTARGYQHATEEQVAQLFINSGLVMPDSTPITNISLSLASSIAPLTLDEFYTLFDAVEVLSILLGDTALPTGGASGHSFGVTGTSAVPSNHSTVGIQAAYSPFTPSSNNCWGFDTVTCDTLRHSLAINLPSSSQGDASAGGQTGHFLVRATPTSSIPEPSTFALFGLGLAGLGAATRRRKLAS
jgi:hypothetical protein